MDHLWVPDELRVAPFLDPAIRPGPYDKDPVLVVVGDVERAVTRIESKARGLPAEPQRGAAAESQALACRREQVGALVERRLVDLGVADQ